MSDGFANPLVGGGGGLVYPSIHSPNFLTGVSGWTINKDGSAEFDNLTLRGTFNGTDWEISKDGIFFYSGTPAAGNLVKSITNGAGTDSHGNAYLKGDTSYANDGFGTFIQEDAGLIVLGNTTYPTVAAGAAFAVLETSGELQLGVGSTGGQVIMTQAGAVQLNDGGTTVLLAAGTGITADQSISMASGKTVTADTWHAPSPLGANWATGSAAASQQPVRYRLTVDNEVEIIGIVHTTSNAPAATIWTMPAGYQPGTAQRLGVTINNNAGSAVANALDISTAGVVSLLFSLSATSEDVMICVRYPLS